MGLQDVASRRLGIPHVDVVVNSDVPQHSKVRCCALLWHGSMAEVHAARCTLHATRHTPHATCHPLVRSAVRQCVGLCRAICHTLLC